MSKRDQLRQRFHTPCLGVLAPLQYQCDCTFAECVGRAARVRSNRQLRMLALRAHQTGVSVHLIQRADQRSVMPGAER